MCASSLDTEPVGLIAHPSTPEDAVRRLAVRLRAEKPDILVFHYSLDAKMSRIRVPACSAGGQADALWKHTCFEAFIAPANSAGYHEFNFSPSLEWAIYRFGGYRERAPRAEIFQAPKISVHRGDDGLVLESTVRLAALADLEAAHLRIALAAVIEDEDGKLSYWALRHPAGKPDFHHPHGFALEVARA